MSDNGAAPEPRDSVTKCLSFLDDKSGLLPPGAAVFLQPLIRGQLEGQDPEELDEKLAGFADLILGLRSDGAEPRLAVGILPE